MKFNWKALGVFAGSMFVLIVASDTDNTTFGLGLVIAAILAVEIVPWTRGFGLGQSEPQDAARD